MVELFPVDGHHVDLVLSAALEVGDLLLSVLGPHLHHPPAGELLPVVEPVGGDGTAAVQVVGPAH